MANEKSDHITKKAKSKTELSLRITILLEIIRLHRVANHHGLQLLYYKMPQIFDGQNFVGP